jgi:hypothetical protein
LYGIPEYFESSIYRFHPNKSAVGCCCLWRQNGSRKILRCSDRRKVPYFLGNLRCFG